jgi:CMP-N,N'-diacetyllegionaminic acid synthase
MNICIIPARGGSKGIKDKNLRRIKGKSLLRRAVEVSLESKIFDKILVSTDSCKIAEEARSAGAEVPFMRPDDLSGDSISDLDVLTSVVKEAEKYYSFQVKYIAMIQPTSPLRQSSHIIECYEKIRNDNLDAVWTVSPCDLKYHPLKQLKISSDRLELCEKRGKKIIARQELDHTYTRNGVCYFFTRRQIIDKKSIYAKRMGGIIIDTVQVSIDTIEDLKLAEQFIEN